MPWPFRRRGTTPVVDSPMADTTVGDSSGPVPEAPAAPGRPSGQWRDLPAMAPALRPPSAPAGRGMAGQLSARWQPSRTLQPLGHDVTVQAPSGLITGLARPAAPPSPSWMSNESLPAPA